MSSSTGIAIGPPAPRNLRLQILRLHQELRRLARQVRPEVMKQKEGPPEHTRRHHHIRIHRPERNPNLPRQHPPPSLRLAQRILIAHQHRRPRLFQKPLQRALPSPTHHPSNSALRRVLSRIAQRLLYKVEAPQVRMRIVGNHGEINHHRQAQMIARRNRHIQRRIIRNPHRPLHPVNDALPIPPRRAAPPRRHPRLLAKPRNLLCHILIRAQSETLRIGAARLASHR